ncbi:AAA family ATPase [Patescibacteria group bacterium]|nr:AAA family ATPase [Patescibacteria group bacterium]
MHFGLSGYMASGKGEIAKILKNQGYNYISLSDIVREEATKKGLGHSREELQNTGNDLRQEFGAGVLGKKIKEKISDNPGNWVIDGIRNPAETQELQKLNDFYLVGVTATDKTILNRIVSRQRPNEGKTLEDIKQKLEREKGIGEPSGGQQVQKCLNESDFLIVNEGSLEELDKKFQHFTELLKNESRPSFDETFMQIAYTWAKRATCERRKVGAVIALDHQQLTAGYNGAPRGLAHCKDAGGCLRAKLGIPSGKNHEICRGTHAEQNAITQAAKFGISIEGSILYCNTYPCVICTKMILNSGIKKVVYDSDYNDPLSKEILENQNHLEIVRYEGSRLNFFN